MKKSLLDLIERWEMSTGFDLPDGSNIVVVGAYQGITMELLARLYPNYRKIIGFEPQEWAVERAKIAFTEEHLSNIILCPYALGNQSRAGVGFGVDLPMGEFHTDACSFVNTESRERSTGRIIDANLVLPDLFPDAEIIDLMVMNIEGGEFELLPYLATTGWLKRIDRLAVQWHPDLEPGLDELRMDAEIHFLDEAGLKTQIDNSPAWTYHTRVN